MENNFDDAFSDAVGFALYKDYFYEFRTQMGEIYKWLSTCPFELSQVNYEAIKDYLEEDIVDKFYNNLVINLKKELVSEDA